MDRIQPCQRGPQVLKLQHGLHDDVEAVADFDDPAPVFVRPLLLFHRRFALFDLFHHLFRNVLGRQERVVWLVWGDDRAENLFDGVIAFDVGDGLRPQVGGW